MSKGITREIVVDIVREEMARLQITNTQIQSRSNFSQFETYLVKDHFDRFCNDLAVKTGRTERSIACKVRRMMQFGEIITW